MIYDKVVPLQLHDETTSLSTDAEYATGEIEPSATIINIFYHIFFTIYIALHIFSNHVITSSSPCNKGLTFAKVSAW